MRVIHTDLLHMVMDDEVYRRSWGPFFAAGDATTQREHMYVGTRVLQKLISWFRRIAKPSLCGCCITRKFLPLMQEPQRAEAVGRQNTEPPTGLWGLIRGLVRCG
ncbi:MAG: DUF6082 family protein [Actinomadura sp.]